ncbi:hypothetical protein QJS10_CPB04g00341 [Acorus calamus]|uniref:Uncharacterized protein n=1 Tax=Acorus calamus TaxID=4465 RepID=A0AAV9F094_ACOCL|nr:hypothetical protein QJS10_CPB04g00341 [Acorus calamus]
MLRRDMRLRREYLYRKSLEGKESFVDWIEGKPIPTEIRNEETALRKETIRQQVQEGGHFE